MGVGGVVIGQAFDLSQYTASVNVLSAMGFGREQCLEALVMTENRGIEPALEVLFIADALLRRKRREEAVERLGRQKASIGGGGGGGGAVIDGPGSNNDLPSQLTALRRSLDAERALRTRAETELRQALGTVSSSSSSSSTPTAASAAAAITLPARLAYREFVKGLLVDEMSQIRLYRAQNSVTASDAAAALRELGVAPDKVDSWKRFDSKTNHDCVVCLDSKQSPNHTSLSLWLSPFPFAHFTSLCVVPPHHIT